MLQSADQDLEASIYLTRSAIHSSCPQAGAAKSLHHAPQRTLSRPRSNDEKQAVWTKAQKNVREQLRACEPVEAVGRSLSDDDVAHLRGVLERFHYGAGSARWVNGTSHPHTDLEAHMQRLFGVEEAISMGETRLARLSLSRALSRPVKGTARNLHLVPTGGTYGDAFIEGQISSARSSSVHHLSYTSMPELRQTIESAKSSQPSSLTTAALDVLDRNLGLINELVADCWFDGSKATHVLFSGSFFRCFQTCGYFVVGQKQLVDEMRWASVGYMFSTTTPPLLSAVNMLKLKQVSN
ncbi:hypothetical protein OC846_006147 [Tilletia horrida]|uniref:Uncharacterized protein n=1 Tax=Tilletia horrida TaxID=155126 RepID=A0AAN6JPL0_9BASI|nr:hypothetical protein OC846_006147 [Tilletia horrida]KAK0561143.1 hypothetical protein OC861_005958 [Tilletia horrida]